MIRSMTGFGRARAEAADKDITVEIRAVNSRYFDCNVKAPRVFAPYEEKIKAYLQKNATTRGKVDVYVTVDRHAAEAAAVSVDIPLATAYLAALRRLAEELSLPDDITVMRVAENRDLFTYERAEEDAEAEWERLLPVLRAAASDFLAARSAEGERTRLDITEKLAAVEEMAEKVERLSLADKAGYRDKLEARLRQLMSDGSLSPDEGRLLTEVAVFADRIAIDEELVRLRSHFVAFRELVASPEPAGRRLDFMMQELNRETNTIGSKAQNAEIAHLVVAMKGELEKIREQVQNVE
ncbi:MAG: YicC family protein [Clostridia bacterium]|nr:YicC family protein [Clostridia bacterium]